MRQESPEGATEAERLLRLGEALMALARQELRDVGFLRQLALAHSEGLLPELLQAAERLSPRAQLPPQVGLGAGLAATENQSTVAPLSRHRDLQTACELPQQELLSQSTASAFDSPSKHKRPTFLECWLAATLGESGVSLPDNAGGLNSVPAVAGIGEQALLSGITDGRSVGISNDLTLDQHVQKGGGDSAPGNSDGVCGAHGVFPVEHEITDKMLSAGVHEFHKFDRRYDDAGETVEGIWKAMVAAKNAESSST